MAKDGTARGGARVGAGRKPKALADKVAQGITADVLQLPDPADIEGVDVPPVKEYMKASQKSGIDLCAEEVFRSTYLWLKERGCERHVAIFNKLGIWIEDGTITPKPGYIIVYNWNTKVQPNP
jgi:hypothetical protein